MKFFRKAQNKKIDFIIAGVQKSGTTALDKYLRKHPNICMANIKEIHYFDHDDYFLHQPNYKKYHSYFNHCNAKDKLLGEATPIYMYWYDAPRRIWEYNPEIKVIIILRNPIERAYSQWNMNRIKNKDPLSFWDAIQKEEERRKEALPNQHRLYSYIDRGFYTEQLKRIWHFFPKDQTLIIKNEKLKNHPHETLNQTFNFLNIPILQNITPKDIHSRPYISSLSFQEFEYLKNIFFMEIKMLEKLLNWDCSEWLEYPSANNFSSHIHHEEHDIIQKGSLN